MAHVDNVSEHRHTRTKRFVIIGLSPDHTLLSCPLRGIRVDDVLGALRLASTARGAEGVEVVWERGPQVKKPGLATEFNESRSGDPKDKIPAAAAAEATAPGTNVEYYAFGTTLILPQSATILSVYVRRIDFLNYSSW